MDSPEERHLRLPSGLYMCVDHRSLSATFSQAFSDMHIHACITLPLSPTIEVLYESGGEAWQA